MIGWLAPSRFPLRVARARNLAVTAALTVILSALTATLVASPASDPVGRAAVGAPAQRVIVLCAPGYPGNTLQAQPTMDAFAKSAAHAAGWPEGKFGAVYYETEKGGVNRLAADDAAMALVPLPFFLQHGATLGLKPRLETEQESGGTEVWSLVAKKGAITSPASLDGWELTGRPGYAPAFVRGPILRTWGAVPATVRITFSAGILSVLRRAAAGEKIAAMLDGEQTASLPALPFANDLEVVARSKPLPISVLCIVRNHLAPAEAEALVKALLRLHETEEGKGVLKTMRIKRFLPVDAKGLEAAQRAFKESAMPAK
jgi:hypothetical protein